jgi:hypothetical protein
MRQLDATTYCLNKSNVDHQLALLDADERMTRVTTELAHVTTEIAAARRTRRIDKARLASLRERQKELRDAKKAVDTYQGELALFGVIHTADTQTIEGILSSFGC